MNLILLIVILILLFGTGGYGYHAGWGVYPLGGVGGLILLLVVLRLFGVI